MRSNNIVCKWFGCDSGEYSSCVRCGLPLYEEDAGILWLIIWRVQSVKQSVYLFFDKYRLWNRCYICNKVINRNKFYCSQECENEAIPF